MLRATTASLFRHLNFKKWSEPGVFCTFSLGNVLRATTACTFSSLIWPAGSAPAALASLLFDPPEPQIIGKTQWIATFSVSRRSYLFAHLHLLSSDLFSSDSFHLCFSTVHIVGSFTSKLPSIIIGNVIIPTDELIFFRGVAFKPPTRSYSKEYYHIIVYHCISLYIIVYHCISLSVSHD